MKKIFVFLLIISLLVGQTSCKRTDNNSEIGVTENDSVLPSIEDKDKNKDESISESKDEDNNSKLKYGTSLFNDGLTSIITDGKIGYIDKKGNVVIGCQYDEGSGFYNGVAFVKTEDDVYYSIDTKGNIISKIDNAERFLTDEYQSSCRLLRVAYQMGIIKEDGTSIKPFDYFLYDVYIYNPYINILNNGYAVIINKGEEKDKYYYGIYNYKNHTVTIEPIYERMTFRSENEYINATIGEKGYVLDFDGKIITEFSKKNKFDYFSDGYILYDDENVGLKGFYNSSGETVIAPKYYSASDFYDGVTCVSISEGLSYLIDKDENILSNTYKFIVACDINDTRVYKATYDDSNFGIINKEGEEIIPFEYNDINVTLSGHIVAREGKVMRVFDQSGNIITEHTMPSNYENISIDGIYDDGYMIVSGMDYNDRVCGVIDKDGKLILGYNYKFGY